MVSPNEFIRTEMNVLSRGFIPPEEVAAAERQPIAMIRSHVSWGGVIAGSLLTFGLLMLSASFAIACGVPAFTGTGSYGFGAGLWAVVTAIIAYGCGGWLAGCLTSDVDSRYRFIHGVMTWALTLTLVLMLSQGAISILGRGGAVLADVREMTLAAPHNDGAWGAFIGMVCGLAAALIGAAIVDLGTRRTTVKSTTVTPTA